ncbi:MAG: hypothetical protein ACE149_03680 [Armatimonadota bacterium]
MGEDVRTVVTFRSTAFNTTESKDYFINEGCFGDDLAKWLIQELRARGFQIDDEPDQEDFGWYFDFGVGDTPHCLVIAFRPPNGAEEGDWVCWLERSRGLLSSALGFRNKGIQREAAEAIHAVLASSAQVREVRWHLKKDFDSGHEELGVPSP